MPKEITIYAGSFKPPHKGHLHLVKKMLKMTKNSKGMVYIFISKKEREPCSKLTGELSKELWKEYIETLPKKDQERVKLVLSKLTSPTQTAYGFVKEVSKKGDTFFLIKSVKDADNKRFSSFKTLKNINYKELVLPGYKYLNSTDMRKALQKKDKKMFYTFLPKMSSYQKNKIWKKLSKLCN